MRSRLLALGAASACALALAACGTSDPAAERNEAEGETLSVPADRVALALGFRPTGNALAEQIEGPQVLVLGDASRPADFVSAINSGADAGLTV